MRTRILGVFSLVSMFLALYFIFMYAPTEQTMGDVQRIFYFHLPLAISSYVAALLVSLGGLMFLIKRNLAWDRFAFCSAELGVTVTAAQLMTGMIWAKPVWGTYWAWDARGTLQLMLGLIFAAYLMLRAYLPEREKRANLSAVFGLLAGIDVPFNYMSIRWWRTQHPQPVIFGGGLDRDMQITLTVSLIAFGILFAYLLVQRIQIARVEEQVEHLEHLVHAA